MSVSSSVYGWIERSSNVFSFTDNTTIALYALCNLAIGVSDSRSIPTAALYVNSNNQIGLGQQPVSSLTYKPALTSSHVCLPGASNMFQMSASNITGLTIPQGTSNFVTTFEALGSGITRAPLFVSPTYKVLRSSGLSNMYVYRIHDSNVSNPPGSSNITPAVAMYVSSNYIDDLNTATTVLLNKQAYKVLFVEPSRFNNQLVTKVVASKLLTTENDLSIRPGDSVNLEFIDDLSVLLPQNQNGVTYRKNCTPISIQTYNFSSNSSLYPNNLLNLTFVSPGIDDQMKEGNFYSLSFNVDFKILKDIPNNFLVLKSVINTTVAGVVKGLKQYICQFQSVTKADDLHLQLGSNLASTSNTDAFIFPYSDAPIPPRKVTESNVVVGFARDNRNDTTNIYISSQSLSSCTAVALAKNDFTINRNLDIITDINIDYYNSYVTRGIDTLKVDSGTSYDVIYHERIGDDPSVYLRVTNPPDLEQTVVMRRQITYDLLGIPLNITGINVASVSTITYTFTTPYPSYFQSNLSSYDVVFIIDYPFSATWKLQSLTQTSMTVTVADPRLTTRYTDILEIPFINEVRTIFIIPYSQLTSVATLTLGEPTTKIVTPASLCVGTSNTIATATIAGDASIVNTLMIQDFSSDFSAKFNYTNNTLSISTTAGNPQIQIAYDTVQVADNLSAAGIITCKQLVQLSDCNLKTDITASDPVSDLSNIKSLPVYNYRFKNDATLQKGVIAQDVARLFPDAIQKGEHIWDLSSFEGCPVNVLGEIVSFVNPATATIPDVEVSKIILYSSLAETYSVHTVKNRLKPYTWSVDPIPHNNITHATAVILSSLAVNYDYLFVMTMNSIKELDNKLTKVMEELHDLKKAQ
jgi:hypothetical protein